MSFSYVKNLQSHLLGRPKNPQTVLGCREDGRAGVRAAGREGVRAGGGRIVGGREEVGKGLDRGVIKK